MREEDLQRAKADSELTLLNASDHPVTYWAQGDLLRDLGDRFGAINAYTTALELEVRPLEKFSRQVKLVEVASYVRSKPTAQDPEALVLLAFLSLFDKDNDDAIASAITNATAALRLDPEFEMALAIRGTAYLRQGNLDQAQADLVAAQKLEPLNMLASVGLARVAERKGPPADALAAWQAYEEIGHLRDQQVDAKLGEYRALTALGRTDDAKRKLDEIATIAPGNPLPKPATK
jgi:tetratricopeptide (TPR) repeat protein